MPCVLSLKKIMDNTRQNQQTGSRLLHEAHAAWMRLESIRTHRLRNKNYAYGNQWADPMTDENGRLTTEYDYLKASGKEPLSNNLIRHIVKSVVGRFRTMADNRAKDEDRRVRNVLNANLADEVDSRAMEEFLISGCCFQRVWIDERDHRPFVSLCNVSPDRMFLNPTEDIRGWDCDLIGQLHDLSLADIVKLLADGNRSRARDICAVYHSLPQPGPLPTGKALPDFARNSKPGKCRIIELWTLESRECYECHDPQRGEWFTTDSPDEAARLTPDNVRWTVEKVWRCHWLAPDGTLLHSHDSPRSDGAHPFVFRLYPLTDGEVHSMVEDVIDQQKYVNRLITLVDHILGASAKGALLYPDTALPEGYTWDDLRYAWSRPDSIIPFHPRGTDEMPRQISVNATDIGAYEMLNLQMKLLEQISGVTGVMQGRSGATTNSVRLYESEIENATIALNDLFRTFESFCTQRNSRIARLSSIISRTDVPQSRERI